MTSIALTFGMISSFSNVFPVTGVPSSSSSVDEVGRLEEHPQQSNKEHTKAIGFIIIECLILVTLI